VHFNLFASCLSSRRFAVTALTASLLIVSGCGAENELGLIPIRGEVTYNGKPLSDGSVIYVPVEPNGRQASGRINADGTFDLTTLKGKDGAMKGSYQIAVYALKSKAGGIPSREDMESSNRSTGAEPEFVVPEKYADPSTSELTDTVDESHSGFQKIELTD